MALGVGFSTKTIGVIRVISNALGKKSHWKCWLSWRLIALARYRRERTLRGTFFSLFSIICSTRMHTIHCVRWASEQDREREKERNRQTNSIRYEGHFHSIVFIRMEIFLAQNLKYIQMRKRLFMWANTCILMEGKVVCKARVVKYKGMLSIKIKTIVEMVGKLFDEKQLEYLYCTLKALNVYAFLVISKILPYFEGLSDSLAKLIFYALSFIHIYRHTHTVVYSTSSDA